MDDGASDSGDSNPGDTSGSPTTSDGSGTGVDPTTGEGMTTSGGPDVDDSIYGDCVSPNCGGTCLSDEPADPGASVCSDACTNVSECPPAPGGVGTPVCADLTGDDDLECYLDCSTGQACPDGMACLFETLCAWDADPGTNGVYDECRSNFDCPANSECVTPDDGTTNWCAPTCNGSGSFCPSHAEGESGVCNIVVGEQGDSANHCSITCNTANDCPTGASCVPLTSISVCSWPS